MRKSRPLVEGPPLRVGVPRLPDQVPKLTKYSLRRCKRSATPLSNSADRAKPWEVVRVLETLKGDVVHRYGVVEAELRSLDRAEVVGRKDRRDQLPVFVDREHLYVDLRWPPVTLLKRRVDRRPVVPEHARPLTSSPASQREPRLVSSRSPSAARSTVRTLAASSRPSARRDPRIGHPRPGTRPRRDPALMRATPNSETASTSGKPGIGTAMLRGPQDGGPTVDRGHRHIATRPRQGARCGRGRGCVARDKARDKGVPRQRSRAVESGVCSAC